MEMKRFEQSFSPWFLFSQLVHMNVVTFEACVVIVLGDVHYYEVLPFFIVEYRTYTFLQWKRHQVIIEHRATNPSVSHQPYGPSLELTHHGTALMVRYSRIILSIVYTYDLSDYFGFILLYG